MENLRSLVFFISSALTPVFLGLYLMGSFKFYSRNMFRITSESVFRVRYSPYAISLTAVFDLLWIIVVASPAFTPKIEDLLPPTAQLVILIIVVIPVTLFLLYLVTWNVCVKKQVYVFFPPFYAGVRNMKFMI